jgi:hypothetical protein
LTVVLLYNDINLLYLKTNDSKELEKSAINLLVVMSKVNFEDVFLEIEKHFKPGELPNQNVIITIASLAEVNR